MNPYKRKDPTVVDNESLTGMREAYGIVFGPEGILARLDHDPEFKERFMRATAGKKSRIRDAYIKQHVHDAGVSMLRDNQLKIDERIRRERLRMRVEINRESLN